MALASPDPLSVRRDSGQRPASFRLAAVLTLAAAATPLKAQCATTWAYEQTSPSTAASLGSFAVTVLPNGDAVVGGNFSFMGATAANNIARRSAGAWSALGQGLGDLTGYVQALATLPNGDIVAGGIFGPFSSTTFDFIARWDGTSWNALGSGLDGAVARLVIAPNGDVIAAGDFLTAGGISAPGIARWNGSTWSGLGTGIPGSVYSAAFLPNGDLVACGSFTSAGGVAATCIARWDGSAWHPIGSGFSPNSAVTDVVIDDTGAIVACGPFTTVGSGPALGAVRWNGSAWTAMGSGIDGTPLRLLSLPGGDILVGGGVFLPTNTTRNAFRWDGAVWSPVTNTPDLDAWDWAVGPNGNVSVVGFYLVGGQFDHFLATLSTTCPAAATPFGTACPSSGGNNELAALNLPWCHRTNTTFLSTRGRGLPAAGLAIALTSVMSPGSAPLSLVFPSAAPSCMLYLLPDIVTLTPIVSGQATMTLPLAPTPSLGGVRFYQQWVVVDAAPNPETSTNGLELLGGLF